MVANRLPKLKGQCMARVKSKRFTGVYLNKLSNGDISYSITYKDTTGKMQRVTIGKKSEGITETYAHNKRNEIIGKLRLGEVPAPLAKKMKRKAVTVDDLAKAYFTDKEGTNKTNLRQLQKYNRYIGYVAPSEISERYKGIEANTEGRGALGSRDIHTLTKEDVQRLQNTLNAKGKAPKTINGIIQLLAAIINHSIKEKGLEVANPCTGVKRLKVDDKRERFLSIDEVQRLIDEVRGDTVLYHFVKMALTTGARLEGLLHIQKKDINLNDNSVTIHDLKSGGTYTGFYDDDYKDELQEHIKPLKANDYVIGIQGKRTPGRTMRRHLKPILDRLFNQGLDTRDAKNRVVIHTLRHTFASQLAIKGVPILTIQRLMNHADISMTMRYAKLAPDSGRDAVKGLYQ